MPYGDLNGDRTVNKADSVSVVDAIESGAAEVVYDLNGDGSVDLLDLESAVRLFYDAAYVPEAGRIVKNILLESVQRSVPESG